VSLYDWLLLFHVAGGFAVVAAEVIFFAMLLSARAAAIPADALRALRLFRLGDRLLGAGAILTLGLGIWLAIYLDAYHPWDAWIIAAYVLWLLVAALSRQTAARYTAARERAQELADARHEGQSDELLVILRSPATLGLQLAAAAAVLLFLADMIFKPWAGP
jgi:hypothetical protein